MKKQQLLIVLVSLIVVAAGGFFAGTKYQQSKLNKFRQNFGPNSQGIGQRNGNTNMPRNGFRPVNGEIIAKDDKTITVKLNDGTSKIILVNEKTTINKATQANLDDLKTGEAVAVFGTEGTDQTVTATNIQLNPAQPNQINFVAP